MELEKLWCVAIRPEDDSPFEQTPAASKEIAELALDRYLKMQKAEGIQVILENFDYFFEVQQWNGSSQEHASKMLYTEDWFSQPMYQCKDIDQAKRVFQWGEIVRCIKPNGELITADFEEAKRFYGEV